MRQSASSLSRVEPQPSAFSSSGRRSDVEPVHDQDGQSRLILNLGSGTKTSPVCVNIDWSLTIRVATNPLLRALAPYFLDAEQLGKVRSLAPVVPYNLRKGIPYPENSVDAVYHSHVLEHVDRDSVTKFLFEIKRVLKPGGVHRIVVPDLQRLARAYLSDFSSDSGAVDWRRHDLHIKQMIEQMVRRESAAVWKYGPRRQKIETLLFGDARKRGETHQWMYDSINLTGILTEAGFHDISTASYESSRIPDWSATALDLADDGITEYKPESIYIECVK